ncbi:hypothetical protein [Saccharothrix syringae]|uniref:Uncharacterized protein n=1 Tax=Saccharothrix syringae TaxID=103733 RepID=A0A5Q0GXJ2_SACSY|nr:hypothetical protein [Saccharothrix syringae]QFZ18661.1 hypothetical protein EKG83_15375 [Saccharothrix syringae]
MTDKVDVPPPEPTQRNRYFTGKFMTARDFEADPDYLYGLHRRHNRLLHGAGVVTGFTVTPHDDPTCRSEWVKVSPGVGIDDYGRDLVSDAVLSKQVPVQKSVLCLGYRRSGIEPVPPVSTAPASSPPSEMNRWQDGVFLTWEADVGKKGLVPLARVQRGQSGGPCTVEPIARGGAARSLTRVGETNWSHGKTVHLDAERRLSVRFTRPLHPEHNGVSAHTFRVRVIGKETGTLWPSRPPHWDSREQAAVFSGVRAEVGDWVHVSLLCDFILDENGVPVDGNHLGGLLPSGNGAAGGTFESWFQVGGGA